MHSAEQPILNAVIYTYNYEVYERGRSVKRFKNGSTN